MMLVYSVECTKIFLNISLFIKNMFYYIILIFRRNYLKFIKIQQATLSCRITTTRPGVDLQTEVTSFCKVI